MWSGKGQTDKEVQSILLADAAREQEEEEEEGSDEEDEDFLAIQRLLEKLHELPKVIDTLVQMTGTEQIAGTCEGYYMLLALPMPVNP